MKQALRMSSAAVALAVFLAVPARAQDQVDATSEPAPSLAPPSTEGAIGPAQLRDFSINGKVTRRAETPEHEGSAAKHDADQRQMKGQEKGDAQSRVAAREAGE